MLIFTFCFICFILGIICLFVKSWISYFGSLLFILSFSIPDLYFVPRLDDDLHRYFNEMQFVSQFSTVHSLLYSYKYISIFNYHASSVLYNIFQWLIARTGIFNILPLLSVFIVYVCLMIPFINQRNKGYITSSFAILGTSLAFVLFPYYAVSSTIRWNLASGIFFLLTYFYINIKRKYRLIILICYIPLIFVHEAIIFPVIIMIICTFVRKIRWYYCLLFIFMFVIVILFVSRVRVLPSNNILSITNTYFNTSVLGFLQNNSSKVNFFATVFVPCIYSVIDLILLKINRSISNANIEKELFIIFNLLGIFLIPFAIILQRYTLYIGMIDLFLFIKLISRHVKITNSIRILCIIALIIGFSNIGINVFHSMVFDFSGIIQY